MGLNLVEKIGFIMKKLQLIILLLLFIVVGSFVHAHKTAIEYIIDTDIGGDIDDVLTLLVALNEPIKPLAITTTHIEPTEKARIAKLILTVSGYPEIPVYAGIGTKREDSRELFLDQNPLWPPVFGYPLPVPGEKTWFALQAIPYKNNYGSLFAKMKIEKETAPEYIARIAKTYSPEHQLTIIAIPPITQYCCCIENSSRNRSKY